MTQIRCPYILRWLLALPSAILAVVLVTFPIHWFLLFLYYIKSMPTGHEVVTKDGKPVPFMGIPLETIERLVMAFALPVVFIQVCVRVVPSRKWTVAVVSAVTWIVFLTIVVTWVLSSELVEIPNLVMMVLILSLNLAGVVYALRKEFQEHAMILVDATPES